ncbi:MAG: prenyltransferase/squalene oxidase repeat-containing protein [Promethearchaeota archaeon]
MEKKKHIALIFLFIFIVSISISPWVLAKPRQTYLTDFFLDRQIKEKGFSNSIKENKSVSFEATAYALEVLSFYDLYEYQEWFEIKANVNATVMDDKLFDSLKSELDKDIINIYKVYYLLVALKYLNATLSSSLEGNIKDFLDKIYKINGGFSSNNKTIFPSVVATYYAIRIHKLIDYTIPGKDKHLEWLKNCLKDDGGYGGNSSLSSTIFNTYCAIQAILIIGDKDDLTKKDDTIDYLMDFYIDSSGDRSNYGGFSPDSGARNTLLSSTYYCVRTLTILDYNKFDDDTICAWVLSHQNFRDGGFSDDTDGIEQKVSSITNSYYAFQILKDIGRLDTLDEDVWMVEFNWIILIIVLSALGVAVAVIIFLYRRRKI